MKKVLGMIFGGIVALGSVEAQSIHLTPDTQSGRVESSLITGGTLSGKIQIENLQPTTGKEETDISFNIDVDVKRKSDILMNVKHFGPEAKNAAPSSEDRAPASNSPADQNY